MKNIYIGIFVLGSVLILTLLVYNRKKKFSQEARPSVAKILELKTKPKGTVSTRSIAVVEYYANDSLYRTFVDSYPNTFIGECYTMKYLKSRPTDIEVDFSEKVKCK